MGETVQKINERIIDHKTGFRSPSQHGFCQILCVYFTTGMCKRVKYQIKITEKLLSNEKTNQRSTWTQIRKTKETAWMKRLRTAFA